MENEQVKALSIGNAKVLYAIKFAVLFGIAILAPLAQNQLITGTIVNATLLAAVFVLGLRGAAAIAFFPSIVSLGLGLLPGVMAPMIPFIVMGNLMFAGIFTLLKDKNYWLGSIGGSVLKFVWLFATSQAVISLFIQKPMAAKIAAMMSWPQLFTALSASALVFFIFYKKTGAK
jgi:hypothetical protein